MQWIHVKMPHVQIHGIFDKRTHRPKLNEKPAFFLNTFPKASPLNVCILLCIPVCDFRNSDRFRKEIHYRHSRRKNSLAASQRNMILAFAIVPPHGTKRISITQPSNSRSTSRTTGNIRFLPAGTWECIPECMPENIPRNNSSWEFFCQGLKYQTDFPIMRVHQREISLKDFSKKKKLEENKTCIRRTRRRSRLSSCSFHPI